MAQSRLARCRILYITPGCFDKGGISRYCRYQVQALRDLWGDANVKVLSLHGPNNRAFEEPFTVDWHGTSASLSDKVTLSLRAAELAVRWRPTFVHAAHVNLAPLVLRLARLAHGISLLNVYGLELWSGLSPRRRRALYQMDEVIADCQYTAHYVATECLFPREPHVVRDCVDLRRFSPHIAATSVLDRYHIPDKDAHFVVLTLGRLGTDAMYKGYDRILRVFVSLVETHARARLVVSGEGSNERALRRLSQELGIERYVTFTGAIYEADLPDVYRSASVFSLVSDRGHGRGEGIPLTPLEAMACGIPIIVGNQDGSQEAVVDSRNGYVIDPFDLARHLKVIQTMILDRTRYTQLCAGARAVAVESFGYGRFRDQHHEIYEANRSGRSLA